MYLCLASSHAQVQDRVQNAALHLLCCHASECRCAIKEILRRLHSFGVLLITESVARRMVVPRVWSTDLHTLELVFLHMCRHVGLLTVEVLEARGLKKYDLLGKSDPFVELSTQPLTKEKTSTKKKTLKPHWDETKHVLVQVRPGSHNGRLKPARAGVHAGA